MDLSTLDLSNPWLAVIARNLRLSANPVEVHRICLRVRAPGFTVDAGQCVALLAPMAHHSQAHVRLYTVAGRRALDQGSEIELLVRRCYRDSDTVGNPLPGLASSYICSRYPGETVQLAGPFGSPFRVPDSAEDNVVMIGAGTGMAPFRAFIQRLADHVGQWRGQVHLFHGIELGLENRYENDDDNAIEQYITETTRLAYQKLDPSVRMDSVVNPQRALKENLDEVWALLGEPETHVYVSGLRHVGADLDRCLALRAGSEIAWMTRKNRMRAEGRWQEIVYD